MKNLLLALLCLLSFACSSTGGSVVADLAANVAGELLVVSSTIEDLQAGSITKEEAASNLSSAVEAVKEELKTSIDDAKKEAEETDWEEEIASIGISIALAFLGVNGYRNRSMPGTTRKPPVA